MSALNTLVCQISQDVSRWASSWMRHPAPPPPADVPLSDDPQNSDENNVNDPPVIERDNSEIISNAMAHAKETQIWRRLTDPKHRKATKLWSKLCHKIDVAYPPKEHLRPIDLSEMKENHTFDQDAEPSLLEQMRYSLRHAFTAYQPAVVAMKSEELSLAFKSLTTMLMTCFHLKAEDILIDHCSPKLDRLYTKAHEPAYYLAVDHQRQKIVLSIRGSSSIGDVITDVNAKCKRYECFGTTGYVHEGILEAAQFVHKSATDSLVTACQQYMEYQVVITGHSLGAAVAALLGLMYKDHAVIRGGNGWRLKVWCFASPPVISREFTDRQMANDYITSVALETDVVTRLSWESVRKCNLRQDLIMKYDPKLIQEIMGSDELDCNSVGAEFLRTLETLNSPKPEEQLFPLGRVLWFVPRIVMDDDIVFRRKTLMKLVGVNEKDEHQNEVEMVEYGAEEEVEENQEEGMDPLENDVENDALEGKEDGDWKNRLSASMKDLYENLGEGLKVRSQTGNMNANQVFREFCHDIHRGVKDIQTDIRCKMDTSRRRRKYGGRNFVLCDATQCRYIFQEFVFEFPDSLRCHNPQRYLWACDATLRM